MEKRRGHYLGTEIDGKWWKRYRRSGFFARGLGECWIEDRALFFRRYLTRTPLLIPLEKIRSGRLGSWHAGRWALGRPIVKISWVDGGLALCSGFLVSRDEGMSLEFVRALQQPTRPGA